MNEREVLEHLLGGWRLLDSENAPQPALELGFAPWDCQRKAVRQYVVDNLERDGLIEQVSAEIVYPSRTTYGLSRKGYLLITKMDPHPPLFERLLRRGFSFGK